MNNVLKDSIKVIIGGDMSVGKSSFIKRLSTGQFETQHNPTIGVEVTNLKFNTNIGEVEFSVWDVSGADKFKTIIDGYYIQAKCAIIMFDVSSEKSYENVKNWYESITHVTERIPIVLCGNKVDIKDRKVKAKNIIFHRKKNLQYYDISVLSCYNLEKPFLKLISLLSGRDDICFITPPSTETITTDYSPTISTSSAFPSFNTTTNTTNQSDIEDKSIPFIPLTFFDPNTLNDNFSKNKDSLLILKNKSL